MARPGRSLLALAFGGRERAAGSSTILAACDLVGRGERTVRPGRPLLALAFGGRERAAGSSTILAACDLVGRGERTVRPGRPLLALAFGGRERAAGSSTILAACDLVGVVATSYDATLAFSRTECRWQYLWPLVTHNLQWVPANVSAPHTFALQTMRDCLLVVRHKKKHVGPIQVSFLVQLSRTRQVNVDHIAILHFVIQW